MLKVQSRGSSYSIKVFRGLGILLLAAGSSGYHHFRGGKQLHFLLAPPAGPAPSTVNVAAANQAGTGATPIQSLNKAPCGSPPAGASVAAVAKPVVTPSSPVTATGTFYLSDSPQATGPVVAASATSAAVTSSTASSNACIVGGASSAPAVDNPTGKYVAMAIGGLIGLVTIASIVQKYKTMGSYSSFWGRMLGLLSGAAAGGLGYMDLSSHSANDCANLFGNAELSSPCPCLACSYVLFAYGAFQLIFNLPFLYANEKMISSMYAKFGLFYQGSLMLTLSGAAAGGVKFMSGSIAGMAVCALGVMVALLFFLGWFKGEDGVLSRLFQSAKDMLNGATEQAAALVDDGLKMFGLNADERSKVTTSNVYNFCRVVRGPDWSAGDEDGGPDGPGGEIIGYIGENGVAEGVAVSAASPGWAKVKWDPKVSGQPAKTAEYRIGAGNKFQLKMAEETEGIVDKLMGQTFAMFGYDPNANKAPPKEKKQIEFILTSKLPGEVEEEKEAELNNDDGDNDDEDGGPSAASGKSLKPQPVAATESESIILTAELFDLAGKSTGKCDDLKSMLFKSAIRHRQLGNKQDAIVIEFQKLPPEVRLIALCAKLPNDNQIGHWASINIRTTSVGHDLSRLSLSQQEGVQEMAKHQGSRGFLYFILFSPENTSEWYAKKINESLGSSPDVTGALNDKIFKFLTDREPKKSSKKKKTQGEKIILVETSDLVSVDQVFENLKIELQCEAQARDMMNAKVAAMTDAYAAKLRQQGVPAQQAVLQGKKLSLIQINKQHQLIFQKTLVVKRAIYLKQRVHPVHAMILAKKDANRAALYDGKEAQIRQAVMNTIKEEKDAIEEAKRQQEAEAGGSYAGQASALVSSMWGWAGGSSDEMKKKKKKKKKNESSKTDEDEAATVEQTKPALPPQFANMTPEQLAAIRALQQRQMAAKSAAVGK